MDVVLVRGAESATAPPPLWGSIGRLRRPSLALSTPMRSIGYAAGARRVTAGGRGTRRTLKGDPRRESAIAATRQARPQCRRHWPDGTTAHHPVVERRTSAARSEAFVPTPTSSRRHASRQSGCAVVRPTPSAGCGDCCVRSAMTGYHSVAKRRSASSLSTLLGSADASSSRSMAVSIIWSAAKPMIGGERHGSRRKASKYCASGIMMCYATARAANSSSRRRSRSGAN